jgi:hypothetical protein
MKEKWMKEVGFCPNQTNQFSYSCDPYLFWTLDFLTASEEFGFLSILDQYGYKKDKIEECPFCHGKIEFIEVE